MMILNIIRCTTIGCVLMMLIACGESSKTTDDWSDNVDWTDIDYARIDCGPDATVRADGCPSGNSALNNVGSGIHSAGHSHR